MMLPKIMNIRNLILIISIFLLFPQMSYAKDSLALSTVFFGTSTLAESNFDKITVGPLKDKEQGWRVNTEKALDVAVIKNNRVSFNLSPHLLALKGSSRSRLTLPFKQVVSEGRVRLSFNLFFLLSEPPPSVVITLRDEKGQTGPSVRIDASSGKNNDVGSLSTIGGKPFPLKRFISPLSSASPRHGSDIVQATVRIVADLDDKNFTIEQNLDFARSEYRTADVPIHPFANTSNSLSSLQVDVEPGRKGTMYLNSIVVEGPIPSSRDIDELIASKRIAMSKTVMSAAIPRKSQFPQNVDGFRDAIIWQTNPVVHTPDGLLNQYVDLIPRLKDLGINMVYFVPLWKSNTSPVGGLIGFPINDGYSLNPAFGDDVSFKSLIKKLHENNIKVIVDFAFHSAAWSSPLLRQHPEWFVKIPGGTFFDGFYQKGGYGEQKRWIYMYRLDYTYDVVQSAIIDMMKYWVKEFDIDGFRLDVAFQMSNSSTLPLEYRVKWGSSYESFDIIRRMKFEVGKLKPGILFLTESANRGMVENGSDLEYSGYWRLRKAFKECSEGRSDFRNIVNVLRDITTAFSDTKLFLWGLETHDYEPSTIMDKGPSGGFGLPKSKLYMSLISALPGAIVMFGGQEEADRWYYQDGWYPKREESAIYNFYKRCFETRRKLRFSEGYVGDIIDMRPDSNTIAAFLRSTSVGQFILVINQSADSKIVSLKVPTNLNGRRIVEKLNLTDGGETPENQSIETPINIGPYTALIFKLNSMT